MSKEDKATEMARRREERKQVCRRTNCWYISTNECYTEDCATEGAEEGHDVDDEDAVW